MAQFLPPIGNAFISGKVDHALYDRRAYILKNQYPAGVLVLLNHRVDRLNERGHIEGIQQLQGVLERFQQFIFNLLQQREAVAVMGVKGRPVQLRQFADLLDGDLVDWFLLQQRQKGFFQNPLCISYSRVSFSHGNLHTECLQIFATPMPYLSVIFRRAARCRLPPAFSYSILYP